MRRACSSRKTGSTKGTLLLQDKRTLSMVSSAWNIASISLLISLSTSGSGP
ncbi:hypothetical protein MGSAQ_002474 [marine sediment metagenome]|uniref:Uncharacterized protein n=1 Tax=marine sediment metagenome TaxID=412755 RepID=A0A1B6NRD9_9ZZZZ